MGDGPRAVVLSADGTRAYVANTDDDTVTVINTTTNTTVRTIQVGDRPTGLALNTAGSTLYVANAGGNSVTSINTATGAVITTVGIGHEPTGITVSPDGNFVYTANADNTVTIVTVATGHAVSVGIDPSQIVTNAAGTRLYALNSTDGDVSIINPTDGSPIDTIHVGADSFGMAVSPDDQHLYITRGGTENKVYIFDLSDKSSVPVDVGLDPRGIAVTPDGTRLYVANYGSDTVSIIDLTDNNRVTDITVGDGPWGISVDSLGTKATVTNSLSDTVTVILIAGNEPPVLHPTQSTNFGSGVVSGSLGATDADGDALSYSVTTQGTLGTVAIDGAGNYLYTPTPAARHAAAATPATDTFTLTVDDGHGSSVTKTISAVIAPANHDPNIAPVASSPADGVVTIDLNGSDPDGDAITYAVVTGPARGTLAVLAPGQFRYTPTDAARSAAAATSGLDSDSFTVTVTDGLGGTTTQQVSVSIAPTRVVGELSFTSSGNNVAVNAAGTRAVVATTVFDAASQTNSTRLTVIDTATGQQLGNTVTVNHAVSVGTVFAADNTRAVVTAVDTSVPGGTTSLVVLDMTTGQQLGGTLSTGGLAYQRTVGAYVPAGFNATQNRAAVTVYNAPAQSTTVLIVNTATGASVGNPVTFTGRPNMTASFDTDGNRIVATSFAPGSTSTTDTRIVVINAITGTQLGNTLIAAGGPTGIAFNASGSRSIVSANDFKSGGFTGAVTVINTDTGAQIGNTLTVAGGATKATFGSDDTRGVLATFAFDPATATGSTNVVVIDTETATVVGPAHSYIGSGGPLNIAFSPDGTRLVVRTASINAPVDETYVAVLDTASGTELGRTTLAGSAGLEKPLFFANGTRAVMTTYPSNSGSTFNGEITVIDTATGTVVGSPIVMPDGPSAVYFTADNSRVILTAYDQATRTTRIRVVDLASGSISAPVEVHGAPASTQLSADGSRVAVTTSDYNANTTRVAFIDAATGAAIGGVFSIAGMPNAAYPFSSLSPNGSRLVLTATSGSGAGASTQVAILDATTGQQVGSTVTVTGDMATQVAFSGARVVVPTTVSDGVTSTGRITIISTATGLQVGETITADGEQVQYGSQSGATATVVNSATDGSLQTTRVSVIHSTETTADNHRRDRRSAQSGDGCRDRFAQRHRRRWRRGVVRRRDSGRFGIGHRRCCGQLHLHPDAGGTARRCVHPDHRHVHPVGD